MQSDGWNEGLLPTQVSAKNRPNPIFAAMKHKDGRLVDTYIHAFRGENVCTKVCRLQSSTHSLVHLPHVSTVVSVWD